MAYRHGGTMEIGQSALNEPASDGHCEIVKSRTGSIFPSP